MTIKRDDEQHEADLDQCAQVQVPARLRELVGDDGGHRVLRGEQRPGQDPRVVADDHRDGHGFAERATEAEHDRADDADRAVEEGGPDGLPPGRAQRVGPFALRDGNGFQHLTGDGRGERRHHDGQNQGRRQHPDPDRRAAEQRKRAEPLGHGRLESAHERHQHEDAPQAVDDRGDRRQQFGEERQRLPQPRGAQLGQIDRDAQRNGRRDEKGEDGRVERSPDEGTGSEVARDGIPGVGAPEAEAELVNRQQGLAIQFDADARRRWPRASARTHPSPV